MEKLKQKQISRKWLIVEGNESEVLDSKVLVEHIWDTFHLVMFKVIWSHLVYLRFFHKYASTLMILFHPNFFISDPCDSWHNSYFL